MLVFQVSFAEKTRLLECQRQIEILEKREISYLNESKKLDELPMSINNKIENFQGLYNDKVTAELISTYFGEKMKVIGKTTGK